MTIDKTSVDKTAVQFMLLENKGDIRWLEEAILHLRNQKSVADAKGIIDVEYAAHEGLKFARNKLKQYVNAQKMLKKLLKNPAKKPSKKHRKGEGK